MTWASRDYNLLPVCRQSTPSFGFLVVLCSDLRFVRVSTGDKPEFSAKAIGTLSRALANDLIPHWSREAISSDASLTAKAHATSGAPPP